CATRDSTGTPSPPGSARTPPPCARSSTAPSPASPASSGWRTPTMTDPAPGAPPPLALVLLAQRESWQRGERAPIEGFLRQHPPPADAEAPLLAPVYNERMPGEEAGERPALAESLGRFPPLAEALRIQFEVDQATPVDAPAPADHGTSPWVPGPAQPALP